MYENEIHVTIIDGIIGIINEFADITLPVKIHFFNDKHMCLDDIPIKYSAWSKLAFELFLWLFYDFLNCSSW